MKQKIDSLQDILEYTGISEETLIEVIDKYLPTSTIQDIYNTVLDDFDIDVIDEGLDMSPDSLIDKISDSDLKNMVKSSGVKLKGNESGDELKGMVKALASVDESFYKEAKLAIKSESSKLKRKKGINHKKSIFLR